MDVSEIDSEGRIIKGSTRYYDCDTLILSVGLIPEEDMIQIDTAVCSYAAMPYMSMTLLMM